MENQNRRIFFFCYRRILVLWKAGVENSRFVENQNRRNFFLSENSRFFLSENCRFSENGNWRIPVWWKTRIGEFFFLSENSLFLENQNRRIFFFVFFLSENSRFVETENSRFVENGNWRILVLRKTRIGEFFSFFFFFKPRILVLWKTGTGEFSFCGKPESENFFFSREFSFFGNGKFSFCGKRKLENSRFVKNQNGRTFFF